MPQPGKLGFALPALLLAVACSHGGGHDNGSTPRTNIDLAINDFAAAPSLSDPDDVMTLTGTIHNLGTEMANPNLGDSFTIMFNLSLSGAFQYNEQGFFQKIITDPIPAGGSLPFSLNAPYGNGDTLAFFGNFCAATGFGCVPPQTGVIGVKLDANDEIKELDETNNFQFIPHQVAGTRVGATMAACDQNATDCYLTIADGHDTKTCHLPFHTGDCGASEVMMPNELHESVSITLQIVGCTHPPCGWGVTITADTQKDPLPLSRLQYSLVCNVFNLSPNPTTCPFIRQIRDPNY